LPPGSRQYAVVDTRGQNLSSERIKRLENALLNALGNIPGFDGFEILK
jgi:hypothetical protein